ncbi:amino acid permease [Desulfovibrio sp. OttesenSCG-928-G15]|nr:amino acid permease [Desulfovibrio sp. OttesenSCG-928-G15]
MKMDRIDREWVLTCFGTAVGAGILFLPIQAGIGGIWPTIALALLALPVTCVAHRGITRIVASCDKPTDIIGAVEQDLGNNVAFVVSILYFLSIVTICVGYATGLTNTINSFLVHQMGLAEMPRALLSFIVLAIMTGVLLGEEKIMVKVTSLITYPLILLLLALSLYMIPKWNASLFQRPFELKDFLHNAFLLLPLVVFAMNFSPVCSSLGAFYRKNCPTIEKAVLHTDRVIHHTVVILLFFVMLFVFSLMLSTTPHMLEQARADNIDILTAVSLQFDEPLLIWMPPIISLLAIISSYFGHFVGTREGLCAIITRLAAWKNPNRRQNPDQKGLHRIVTVGLFLGLWLLAYFNPSILEIIGALSAPIIAVYAYLMPVFLMKKIPRLYIYQSRWGALVFIVGIAGIFGNVLGHII